MASKTVVLMEDDIDGGEAVETMSFGLDGVSYEIDLNEQNAAKLRSVFGSYVGAARRVGGRKVRGAPGPAVTGPAGLGKEDLAQIRAWAAEQGLHVAERGRISAAVLEAWENRAPTPAPKGRRKTSAPAATFSAG